MQICEKAACTGCTVCCNICPKSCIVMTEDELGHFYPKINEKECVECGLCQNSCPANHFVLKHMPIRAYATVSKDEEEHKSSSSGGAASVFAREILCSGGVVYGCTGTRGYDICHVRIDKEEDISLLKGSKYVESRLGDIFSLMKSDLNAGRKVLMIGTPCQIAAAKRLFEKEENLYTVDLICHGVPPQRLLAEHFSSKLPCQPDSISFRDSTSFVITANKNGEVIRKKLHLRDLFYTGFFKMLYFRESCYQCTYAEVKRVSDITCGDFWGIRSVKKLPNADCGISAVLLNTSRGEKLFTACQKRLFFEEHEVQEVVDGNAQLRSPAQRHKNTEKFRKLYQKKGFTKAAKICLRVDRIKYLMLYFYQQLRKRR